eukprot:TRINITY_DN94_c0_g1_i18.p1 TRINITY_DN94_c0_g1~~TRINITY_DN94_c0_g1_i18.p1  ORF type:complete len:254 (-),score=73.55 TRINITY_DN94_c0_g1_i18:347-1108(-)
MQNGLNLIPEDWLDMRVNEMPEFRGRIYAGVDEMKENLEAVSQNTAKTSLEAFSVFINKALEAMSWAFEMDLEFEGGFKRGKKSSFWRSSAVKKKQQEPEATPQTPTLDAQAKDRKKSLLRFPTSKKKEEIKNKPAEVKMPEIDDETTTANNANEDSSGASMKDRRRTKSSGGNPSSIKSPETKGLSTPTAKQPQQDGEVVRTPITSPPHTPMTDGEVRGPRRASTVARPSLTKTEFSENSTTLEIPLKVKIV